ncbi:CAP domain-containing protein [Stappia sp. WLB 29]|uniref:CAP domain-containing protein n=1 Tax=Stappia sp. WLB 29 TaxID=2925220 RepID=UPI0020BE66F6|nr:CAP domain-containing protein [Stappia sp. WLB 29]
MTFRLRIGCVALVGLLAAACMPERNVVPPYYKDLARVDASVDAAAAQQMITSYRQSNGAGSLSIDPALMQVAQKQALAMARAQDIQASLQRGNSLAVRLAAAGEEKTYAVENVSAGYRTIAEAFSGWRDSPKHNAVMLDGKATRMGIATAYAPGSRHKVYWSLVLAGPAGQP